MCYWPRLKPVVCEVCQVGGFLYLYSCKVWGRHDRPGESMGGQYYYDPEKRKQRNIPPRVDSKEKKHYEMTLCIPIRGAKSGPLYYDSRHDHEYM
jgi:hypothetical protein